jgi:hypothetical protein
MKQTNLMRWIETAEARSVCMLAEENPARANVATATPAAQPVQFVLLKLREQLRRSEPAPCALLSPAPGGLEAAPSKRYSSSESWRAASAGVRIVFQAPVAIR